MYVVRKKTHLEHDLEHKKLHTKDPSGARFEEIKSNFTSLSLSLPLSLCLVGRSWISSAVASRNPTPELLVLVSLVHNGALCKPKAVNLGLLQTVRGTM